MASKTIGENVKREQKRFTVEVIRQMLSLATSGLGLVAALAWNNVIQAFVNDYIRKYFPAGGLYSLFLYAIIVTSLAVAVTLQLSKILEKFEQ